MINVGGFGHSGNTALVDFFSDSIDICPIGYDYTESAIIRSKWGVKAIFDNFRSDDLFVKWSFIEDCLIGNKKAEHDSYSPPVFHDFTRNARVAGFLGIDYKELVKSYVFSVQSAYSNDSASSDFLYEKTHCFLNEMCNLAVKKSGNPDAVPLMRNDPAAANIDLLKYSICFNHYTLIRNPADMMYDWIKYYNHTNDESGAKLFSRQFVKKIDDFTFQFNALSAEVKNKIKILRFEDLVLSDSLRCGLYSSNNLRAPSSFGRFNPEESKKNIGIGTNLTDAAVRILNSKCIPKFQEFLDQVPAENLLI